MREVSPRPEGPTPLGFGDPHQELVSRRDWEEYVGESNEIHTQTLADDEELAANAAASGELKGASSLMEAYEISDARVREAAATLSAERGESLDDLVEFFLSGREKGYILANADFERFADSLSRPRIVVVDEVMMHEGDSGGYLVGPDIIEVSSNEDGRKSTLKHESNHRAMGMTALKSEDGHIERLRSGFVNLNVRKDMSEAKPGELMYGHEMIDEVLIEHMTAVSDSGDWDTINPLERKSPLEVGHVIARGVFANIIELSAPQNTDHEEQPIIDQRQFFRALQEDTVPGRSAPTREGMPQRHALVEQVVGAYGWGGMRRIERLLSIADTYYSDEEMSIDDYRDAISYFSSFVTPPHYDNEGNFVQGYIDLSEFDNPGDEPEVFDSE